MALGKGAGGHRAEKGVNEAFRKNVDAKPCVKREDSWTFLIQFNFWTDCLSDVFFGSQSSPSAPARNDKNDEMPGAATVWARDAHRDGRKVNESLPQ